MIQEKRKAARAEREAAAAEARVERETAAMEQRRLMAEVFELNLQLLEERGRRSGVAGGEPWTAGSRDEAKGSTESAVQSGTASGGDRITNPGGRAIGLDGRMYIEPMRWIGSESAPSPARSQALRFGRSSVLGDMGELELLPLYLASFEESPESYLSPSRGAVWGYLVVGMMYRASGICTRYMRRYGSVW